MTRGEGVAVVETAPGAEPAPVARDPGSLIVRLRGVGKRFRRFAGPASRAEMFFTRDVLKRLVGRRNPTDEFWPLRNINAEIAVGETVALVGRNGAGKTTLLSLLAGVLGPTEGTVSRRGRVAALLSLGVGFHPDMTGRECIRINAALLGVQPEEVESRIPEILSFAELGDFGDTPTRFYSSGMRARLGFAIATDVDPDLFLIDEVLSVGDHAFQQKCGVRMSKLKDRGTTIVLVSHATETMRKMCERAIWLNDGTIAMDGRTRDVTAAYLKAGK